MVHTSGNVEKKKIQCSNNIRTQQQHVNKNKIARPHLHSPSQDFALCAGRLNKHQGLLQQEIKKKITVSTIKCHDIYNGYISADCVLMPQKSLRSDRVYSYNWNKYFYLTWFFKHVSTGGHTCLSAYTNELILYMEKSIHGFCLACSWLTYVMATVASMVKWKEWHKGKQTLRKWAFTTTIRGKKMTQEWIVWNRCVCCMHVYRCHSFGECGLIKKIIIIRRLICVQEQPSAPGWSLTLQTISKYMVLTVLMGLCVQTGNEEHVLLLAVLKQPTNAHVELTWIWGYLLQWNHSSLNITTTAKKSYCNPVSFQVV